MFREIIKQYARDVEYDLALAFILKLKLHLSLYKNYLTFVQKQVINIDGTSEDQLLIASIIKKISEVQDYHNIMNYVFMCLFELKTFNSSICFVHKYTLNEDAKGYILEYLHRNSNNFKTTNVMFALLPLADNIIFKIEYKNMSMTYSVKKYIVHCIKEKSNCTPWYKIKT